MAGSDRASTALPRRTLRLRITCPRLSRPLAGPPEFGGQDRRLQLHPGQVTADGLVTFAVTVSVVRRPTDGSVRYRGPFVHGTPTEPFLYLSLRPVGGDPAAWCRRLKVRFPILTWEQLTALPDTAVLATCVSGERSRTTPLHVYEWTQQDADGT
ncbi:MAG: DUF5990 family protein [Chloroflexota bacterium]